ncbi:phosphatidylethanolamine N-methyltransferase [Serendipita sp. 411]|nr:phosphatidylethanolamine N-methyltransferase [Serendipita sp. 411]
MNQSKSGLRKRGVGADDLGAQDVTDASESANGSLKTLDAIDGNDVVAEDARDATVWGKTDGGDLFKVPTTHDVLTLFHPSYPKSHFDLLSLFLLGSQLVIFWLFLSSAQSHPRPDRPQTYSKIFFLSYFFFWRAMYDAGLGWILTKQSKRKWIVNLVKHKAWFDENRRPKTSAWLKRQLVGKMGQDYHYDTLPLEYNTWLLFRQVVDIILLNDFLSYVLFALSNLDFLFSRATSHSSVDSPGMVTLRLLGGVALLLFNLWVKTSAHDVVKDYGWYWGDCFFSRGYLRKSTHNTVPLTDAKEADENAEGSDDLQFDLVFDGIFEMAPHPMYSVGYAGYYGVSLLAASYSVLFVSLAAHAAQFAFLNFFENPHIERRYGVRKVLAERTPIIPISRNRTHNDLAAMNSAATESAEHNGMQVGRSRSVSLETSSEERTAFESEYGPEHYHSGGPPHPNIHLTTDAEIVASITPPNGVSEVVQEAVTQHDLLNKFFRKDVIVLSGLDLLRSQDQLILLLTGYIIALAILPMLQLSSNTILHLHFVHALTWRIYYSFILGLILKGQSDSRFLVRHFLEHYHYSPLSLTESPGGRGDRGVKEGAIREAFDNWKGMYNLGMVMCYVSFFGFALQTYHLPTAWTVGDELLRHTMGVLLVALHLWASKESYEVLGIFGWFFGDFFIDDYPSSLNYTGIYRFLNNPERTMSGAGLFVIWRSPLKHSRRDWVGIYRHGANKSQRITKTSTLGLWVPVHDEEWDGDVPRPLTDHSEGEEAECGEIVFKNSTLPWQTGDYELRYHHDGKYNVVALVGTIQIYLDRPDALDFKSIRQWLLKIVMLALDSDPSLIPKSSLETISHAAIQQRLPALLSREFNGSTTSLATATPSSMSTHSPGTSVGSSSGTPNLSHDIHDDDFRFWSERQAKRISWAISQVLNIDFAPEVIVADANITALTRRILASKELLGP